jgi:hypothetical protein
MSALPDAKSLTSPIAGVPRVAHPDVVYIVPPVAQALKHRPVLHVWMAEDSKDPGCPHKNIRPINHTAHQSPWLEHDWDCYPIGEQA